MITLFAIPKPFQGHFELIQRNAIQSWKALDPEVEIILLGHEEGTREIAQEYGIGHISEVASNEYGTPLLDSIFEKVKEKARHKILGCINADIILMRGFITAVKRLADWERNFLMVGRRWDMEIREGIIPGPAGEEKLQARVRKEGKLHPHTGIDYFVFPRWIWGKIPAFAVGRTAWDNWLIYEARSRGIPVVDASEVTMAVHQNHDYSHASGGERMVFAGPEAEKNMRLAGGASRVFTIEDANYILTPEGLKYSGFRLERKRLRRYLETAPILHPRWAPLLQAVKLSGRLTRSVAQKGWGLFGKGGGNKPD